MTPAEQAEPASQLAWCAKVEAGDPGISSCKASRPFAVERDDPQADQINDRHEGERRP